MVNWMINCLKFVKGLMSKFFYYLYIRPLFTISNFVILLGSLLHRENERKLNEQKSHLKWLQERELKQQELKQAQQLLLRSPAKTSSSTEVIDGEMATSSPSITDQLNIDVSTEEVREQTVAVSSSDTKPVPTTGSGLTPLAPAATPSSPLLTSLLRSPTATSTGPPSATKGFPTPPPKPFTLST